MILLVSYDLRIPGRNYDALHEVLKSADSWWHHLESTWLLRTGLSVNEWNAKLTAKIDQNDRLLIVEITKAARNGWLPQKAWDWIRENDT